MRYLVPCFAGLLTSLAVFGTALAAPPEAIDAGDRIEVKGDYYVAVISKAEGGVLASLQGRDGKTEFLKDHRIYTDYGFYPERGHVGTKNETQPRVALKRDGDAVIVSSEGMLRGKPAEGQKLIPYRIIYTFDRTPDIAVQCEVVPIETGDEVRGFLATCFSVPQMSEWAVNTIDRIIREDVREGTSRNYEAQKLWIDAKSPQVGFITDGGGSLLVADIRCDGPDSAEAGLQNVIIHGKTFFLTWLSGAPVRVKAVPHRVSFRLIVGQGDPMR